MSDKREITFENAPEKGLLLAYFRRKVVFESYVLESGVLKADEYNKYDFADLLELHMFDEKKEFRVILSRRKNDFIIKEITACEGNKNNTKDYIDEEIVLKDSKDKGLPETIMVRNYISYDENGMATIDNFQLMMKKGEEADDRSE